MTSKFSRLIVTAQNLCRGNVKQLKYQSTLPSTDKLKCDVCIIGGGVMGSSIAYWLKTMGQKINIDLKVIVVERDPCYTVASTVLSMGGVRQQFSLKENIQLAMFGSQFLHNAPKLLAVEGKDVPDMQYHKYGYLFVASTPHGAKCLRENFNLQTELGAKVELLSKKAMKAKFPYMNVDDVELACFGLDNEGWFDPWSLLYGLKTKAISLGVEYLTAEATAFETSCADLSGKLNGCGPKTVIVQGKEGLHKTIDFDKCVIAAGFNSGEVAAKAGIGVGNELLSVPLPVEPKKRYVYYIHCPDGPDIGFPMLIDSTGAYCRREGSKGFYLCGQSPADDEEPSIENLEVDYDFFQTHVWPHLANRAPCFENLKVKSAYGAYYDYNTFDQNGVIGTHPSFTNFYFATGFSGHGLQQGPAVGRAIAELIFHNKFLTIDLNSFSFDRFIENRQVLEQNIV